MMVEERAVEFSSQDATLRGRLYLPADSDGRPPIVVMGHGFSATIDGMVADRYAEALCAAGLAVLLYDHHGFGKSGGEPRQQIDRWLQVIGYRDAIGFANTLPEVDASRLALWGDSMSGGCVLVAAAFDARIAAIVVQVPACGSAPPPADLDGALVEAMARVYAHPRLPPASGPVEGPMPVVSADQLSNPSALTPLTAFRWFMKYGARFGTGWQNRITRASRGSAPYHPVLCAGRIRVPTLFLIATDDEMPGAETEVSRLAFDLIPGPKEVVELDGGHFGLLYHPGPIFDVASTAEAEFLVNHLRRGD
jgi:pimeloyl-ACP methyl ester carboxylesterase